MREVLITGMEGMTGSHLARTAFAVGLKVSGTRHPLASTGNIEDLLGRRGVSVHSCDLTDRGDVRNLMAGINPDAIFHLAGKTNNDSSWSDDTLQANIAMSNNLLEEVVGRDSMPRIVLASTINVYGQGTSAEPSTESHRTDPQTPYALSKVTQEILGKLYAGRFGLEVVVARCSQHTGRGRGRAFVEYEIGQQILDIEKGQNPPDLSVRNAAVEMNLLDVRDVAKAYLLLAVQGVSGEIYNVASAQAKSIREIAQIMIAVSHIPNKGMIEIHSQGSERFLPARYSESKISSLGWKPQFTLPETLKDLLDWMREQ